MGSTSGSYLLLASGSGQTERNAQFTSPLLKNSFTLCEFSFWYQINGKIDGVIEIYSIVGAQKSKLYEVKQQTYNDWIKVIVNVDRNPSSFYVTIEGFKSLSKTGYIAIDDLNFTRKSFS